MKKWVILPVYPGLEATIFNALLPYVGLLARGTHKREAVVIPSVVGLGNRKAKSLTAITQEVGNRVRIIPSIDAVYTVTHEFINYTWAPQYARHVGEPSAFSAANELSNFPGLRSAVWYLSQSELDKLIASPLVVTKDKTDDMWRMLQQQKCDVHDYNDNVIVYLPVKDLINSVSSSFSGTLLIFQQILGRTQNDFFWNTSAYDVTKPQGQRVRRTVLVEQLRVRQSDFYASHEAQLLEYDTSAGTAKDIDIAVPDTAKKTDIAFVITAQYPTKPYLETQSIVYQVATNDLIPAVDFRDFGHFAYAAAFGFITIMYTLPKEDGAYDTSVKLRLSNWADSLYQNAMNSFCVKKATLIISNKKLTHILIKNAYVAIDSKKLSDYPKETFDYSAGIAYTSDTNFFVNLGVNTGSDLVPIHVNYSAVTTGGIQTITDARSYKQFPAEPIITDTIYNEFVVMDRTQNGAVVTYAQQVAYIRELYGFYNGTLRKMMDYATTGTLEDFKQAWTYKGLPVSTQDFAHVAPVYSLYTTPIFVHENNKTEIDFTGVQYVIPATNLIDTTWDNPRTQDAVSMRERLLGISPKVGWTGGVIGPTLPPPAIYTDDVGFVSIAQPIKQSAWQEQSLNAVELRGKTVTSCVIVSGAGKTVLRWESTLATFLRFVDAITDVSDVPTHDENLPDVLDFLRIVMTTITDTLTTGLTQANDLIPPVVAEGQKIINGYSPQQSTPQTPAQSETRYLAKYLIAAATVHKTTITKPATPNDEDVELTLFIKALKVGAFTSVCIFP